MKITIEDKSGFCYGVVRVIGIAEELLQQGEEVWCLGQIVHNEAEVNRLTELGMKFIEHKDLESLHDVKLLIRAHGEPPSTYEIAKRNNLRIIEGTCPIVKRLQKKILESYTQQDNTNLTIIIFGKENHPEVIGLNGQTNNQSYIVGSPEEATEVPLKKDVLLFSQTTMNAEEFDKIASILSSRLAGSGGNLILNKSICGHVSHRQPGLIRFARENDIIIFVGGKKSSNAKVLFEVCKNINSNSFFISEVGDLKSEWLENAKSAGVCGATSTPGWQLEEVALKLKEISKY
jgi:4-hydroxy-3-methylbut-2-en-1-yl diphosphate reductase